MCFVPCVCIDPYKVEESVRSMVIRYNSRFTICLHFINSNFKSKFLLKKLVMLIKQNKIMSILIHNLLNFPAKTQNTYKFYLKSKSENSLENS